MKPNEYQHIETLLERFFEGDTSNQEEQELYAFFARRDLPDHLMPYKEMFGYFETGIAQEVAAVESPAPVRKVPFVRRWLWAGIAIAASLSLFLLLNNQEVAKEEGDFNPYAGSYIIRNGVRTEIPEEVARELSKIIQDVEKDEFGKEYASAEIQEKVTYFDQLEKQVDAQRKHVMKDLHRQEKSIRQIENNMNKLDSLYQ
jgi:hypothetical protein